MHMQKINKIWLVMKPNVITVIAFCVAPVIPSIIHFCLLVIFISMRDTLWEVSIYGSISYFAMVVFGIPIYFILKYYRMLNLRSCLSAGAIVAIILSGYFFREQLIYLPRIDVHRDFPGLLGIVIVLLQGLFYGAVTGLSFWAIALRPQTGIEIKS